MINSEFVDYTQFSVQAGLQPEFSLQKLVRALRKRKEQDDRQRLPEVIFLPFRPAHLTLVRY